MEQKWRDSPSCWLRLVVGGANPISASNARRRIVILLLQLNVHRYLVHF
jgi:hypothetical protein